MAKVHSFRPPIESADGRRSDAVIEAIERLVDGLGPGERERLLKRLTEKLRPLPAPQAGDVLGLVIQLIPRDRQWTVGELRSLLDQEAEGVSAKEVYNAVGYLKRKGRVQRVGYGRYVVDGVPFVTADDIGGQPSITEGDLDD